MKIDINLIENLAENIDKYGLSEITMENEDTKITLKREKTITTTVAAKSVVMETAPILEEIVSEVVSEETVNEDENLEAVVSPMVGTFYASPSPDSDAFVKVGQDIEVGDTLCIVEAMKLMNEVKSTVKGKVAKILVKDGQNIKKGDKLFLVK
ncbi:acetyl-CoA carboxylase biotin carboxyl carrier protein [Cetobacterium ceti]|uniref:Biotin carboxyl carrier protein of acetyl-CoA carboxylase n=1 Tax=Cetobacterium ceti TaxID=180163 RepID=A0A1T4JZ54_9FUSO|nr:acetyl-CoA carboxylase biotin carboxyl carrier protein [Cetobacterium ceti]SJZ35325.1 acetyl-CoA carboxylase biotin carboxyl carrier protein [Cetobacterium ceti]